jgi:hypothetical protein
VTNRQSRAARIEAAARAFLTAFDDEKGRHYDEVMAADALRIALALPADPQPVAVAEVLRELRADINRLEMRTENEVGDPTKEDDWVRYEKVIALVDRAVFGMNAIDRAAAKVQPEPALKPSKPFDVHPCVFHLDNGLTVPAVRYGTTFDANSLLFVNLTHPNGETVINKPEWFDGDYVTYWGGIVPECATEGTEPGQWSRT